MPLQFQIRQKPQVPLEVEGILPHSVRGKPLDEIKRLEIFHGNQKLPLGEFFDVSGGSDDDQMVWEGDLSGVHWLGTKMEAGSIRVIGSIGRHLGSEMRGGEIHVDGDAGDWVGGELHGGTIHVRGRAGHLVGSAYRGSARGMTGGTILIEGAAGNEIGHTMRRGLIAVGGKTGDLIGFNMLAGSILVGGETGIRHGAGMRRGSLVFLGPAPPMLPTFRHACRFQPPALRLLHRELQRHNFPGINALTEAFDLYHGDLIEGGRGEILLRAAAR